MPKDIFVQVIFRHNPSNPSFVTIYKLSIIGSIRKADTFQKFTTQPLPTTNPNPPIFLHFSDQT